MPKADASFVASSLIFTDETKGFCQVTISKNQKANKFKISMAKFQIVLNITISNFQSFGKIFPL